MGSTSNFESSTAYLHYLIAFLSVVDFWQSSVTNFLILLITVSAVLIEFCSEGPSTCIFAVS